MRLSYSAYSKFESCSRAYYHGYVHKTKPSSKENKVNTLFGTTIGVLFEQFYTEKLWLKADMSVCYDILLAHAPSVLDRVIQDESKRNRVDWEDPKNAYTSRETILRDIQEGLGHGLRTIHYHHLLDPHAQAEVSLDYTFGSHVLSGRADFILRRPDPYNDLLILDGKGSKHRDKYTQNTQLYWYAALYHAHHGVYPDKLGFVFWKFHTNRAVMWVDPDPVLIEQVKQDALATCDKVATYGDPDLIDEQALDNFYPAAPTDWGCDHCVYVDNCKYGKALLQSKGTIQAARTAILEDYNDEGR